MIIEYLGHSCFLVTTVGKKFLFDPFDPKMVGLPLKKQKCDYCLTSHGHADHNYFSAAAGARLIDIPQNITEKAFSVTAYSTFHDDCKGLKRGKDIVFKLESENFSFVHFGDIGFLDYSLIRHLKNVDAIAIPVGGNYTIDGETAAEYIREINPKAVFPMHYKVNGCKIDISPIDGFLQKVADLETINISAFDSSAFKPTDRPVIFIPKNIMMK